MDGTTTERSICPACGNLLKCTYYQRRSADEAPDKVVYCEVCPVDTSKLSLSMNVRIPQSNSTTNSYSNIHSAKHTVLHQSDITISDRAVVTVEGAAALRCYKQLQQESTTWTNFLQYPAVVHIDNMTHSTPIYYKSILSNMGYITKSSHRIAPFIDAHYVHFITVTSNIGSSESLYVGGVESIIDMDIPHSRCLVRKASGSRYPYISIILDTAKSDMELEKLIMYSVHTILTKYGTEYSVKNFISSSFISSLYIRSSRAYDWAVPSSDNFSYSWKPDGERFWLIKYASIWIYARLRLSGRIAGWVVPDRISESEGIGFVFDVEVLMGHPSILLDVLATSDGHPTPAVRSLDYVLKLFNDTYHDSIPLHVKKYYRSRDELMLTENSIGYPIDGVVGVQDGSMDIIKLKDSKSIELRLEANGDLVSQEGDLIATSSAQDTYDPGSIIEVRFHRDPSAREIYIDEVLLRTDKTTANDKSVCRDIMVSTNGMPDSLARRRTLTWCNTIRHRIHQIAANTQGRGRVVLDVGSGDGQAISDYSSADEVTYLLLEPDRTKCTKLERRLGELRNGECRLFDDSKSIVRILGMLSKRSLKYAIVCDTLSNMLAQHQVIRSMTSCIRYCVCSFSISYVAGDIATLVFNGIDVIGVGYMYDDIDSSGTLIDDSGVVMKSNGDGTASVMWGSDREYKEPDIRTAEFTDNLYVSLASNTVPIPTNNDCTLLELASKKVYIVSTRKHM